MVKGASKYSPACKYVKYIPRITVRVKAWVVLGWLFSRILWWAHVTVTPLARSTAVFSKGTEKGFNGWIPLGGQEQPNSGVGANLLWKNAQKKAKKKQISEAIKRAMPQRIPLATGDVCWPRKVASRITSRHHWIIVRLIIEIPKIRAVMPCPWNHEARPPVNVNAPKDPVSGQGLNSTRWKGWRTIIFFKVLIFLFGRQMYIYILRK
jgi:hypothetical protein